jgi:hypothetical protein
MTNVLISLSGAALRALSTPEATAELARRAAKRETSGKWTVAALRAHGRDADAAAKVAATPKVAFARKTEKVAKVAAPKVERLSMKKLDARIDGLTAKLDAILAKLA